jgi:hypothetical protein
VWPLVRVGVVTCRCVSSGCVHCRRVSGGCVHWLLVGVSVVGVVGVSEVCVFTGRSVRWWVCSRWEGQWWVCSLVGGSVVCVFTGRSVSSGCGHW